jgi:hypothetical protein
MCVTFHWEGFTELLPEERFQRLVAAIPADVRESRLEGFIWLELAPDETVDAFLKFPRSEDVVGREAPIFKGLVKAGFLEALRKALGKAPEKRCTGDFAQTYAVLAARKYSAAKLRDAKLLFIRQGTYCDCQVLASAWPGLTQRYARAKAPPTKGRATDS